MNEIFKDNLVSFAQSSEDGEFIPLITTEDEDQMNKEEFPDELPILSLKNNVLFPGVVIPITVGRDKSIKLINDANSGNKILGVVSQKNKDIEDPKSMDVHLVGTVGQILKHLKMPDGSIDKKLSIAEKTQELVVARDKAMEVSELKSNFISTISHEMRTPLNGIVGATTLLKNEKNEEKQQQLIRMAETSVDTPVFWIAKERGSIPAMRKTVFQSIVL